MSKSTIPTDPARIAKGMYWMRAWQLTSGCTPVSAGCAHCWSAAQAHMRQHQTNPKIKAMYGGLTTPAGAFNGTVRCNEHLLDLPMHTRKPTTWAIWDDLFHESVPFEFIDRAMAAMALCSWHTFLVLTKRPERMLEYYTRLLPSGKNLIIEASEKLVGRIKTDWFLRIGGPRWPIPNIWLGTTVENQAMADARIPLLLQCPAAGRYVSLEPLLGEIDLSDYMAVYKDDAGRWNLDADDRIASGNMSEISLVIAGGETGPGARPYNPDWLRSARDQCTAADVPFFLKHPETLDRCEWHQLPEVKL